MRRSIKSPVAWSLCRGLKTPDTRLKAVQALIATAVAQLLTMHPDYGPGRARRRPGRSWREPARKMCQRCKAEARMVADRGRRGIGGPRGSGKQCSRKLTTGQETV